MFDAGNTNDIPNVYGALITAEPLTALTRFI